MKYFNEMKKLGLLVVVLIFVGSLPAFAGLAKRHPAGTITDDTFPGNYTFNGTVNIFLMISASILLYRKSLISRYVYEKSVI